MMYVIRVVGILTQDNSSGGKIFIPLSPFLSDLLKGFQCVTEFVVPILNLGPSE